MSKNDDDLKEVLEILEKAYINSNKYSSDDDNSRELFPENWDSIDDINTKVSIVAEALDKDLKVIETKEYLKYQENAHIHK